MSSPFNATESLPLSRAGSELMMVNGRTFAIADGSGAMSRRTHGVVFEDTRIVSAFVPAIDGVALPTFEVLASATPTPFSGVVVSRDISERAGEQRGGHVVVQRMWVGRGYRHDIELRPPRRGCRVTLWIGADMAHLFDVKAGMASGAIGPLDVVNGELRLQLPDAEASWVAIRTQPAPTSVDPGRNTLTWDVAAGDATFAVSVVTEPVLDGEPAGILFDAGTSPADAIPLRRLAAWRSRVPAITSTDPRLEGITTQCLEDLASLRIFDRAHPERVVVAAGAPWFMTLFGRDSLLSAIMALPFAPELANGVVHTLAELQGVRDDPVSEEEPGKILHELRRRGGEGAFADRARYYGTVDATPLFAHAIATAHRWGAISDAEVRSLTPNLVAATGWITRQLADGPGGLIAYERRNPAGLLNQGWKDSWDGVNYADGRLAEAPIALSEVQGYAYAALRDVAELARSLDLDGIDADHLDELAEHLRSAFNERFWVGDGWFAMGVDRDLRPIDALTTNPGHALWCEIAEPDRAGTYLDRLTEDDMWTGWGLRTLASSMGAYDPLSYHNGSVWPHDTAICAAGAGRYGRWDIVDLVADGLFDAAAHLGGRPPELFAGFPRDDVPVPVAYPSSCSPQAWASAGILLLVQELVGLTPPSRPGGPPLLRRTDFPAIASFHLSRVRANGTTYRVATIGSEASVVATGPP